MLHNREGADSIISICISLVDKHQDSQQFLFSSLLSYTVEFGSPEEIRAFLNEYEDVDFTLEDTIDFAQGYFKIGENKKAYNIISTVKPEGSIWDSLKYAIVKTDILEKQGDYKQAFMQLKDYTIMQEKYQMKLLSQDLLFAEERHRLEMANLIEVQSRNRIIGSVLGSAFGLLLLTGCIYYRYRLTLSKRLVAEKERANLELEQENLRKEKDKIELERDKKMLEATNLLLEKRELEDERDNLKGLLRNQTGLAFPLQEVIRTRLDMLNGLLAKEISNNDKYAKSYNEWIELMRSDKENFMNSTRLAFAASHPKFMEYLKAHGLSVYEINYLCLYALGLRGKEVGEYIQLKRHYIISSEIRKKLGIDEHETNIGLYVRRKMNEL